jgi:hypothetical protein
MTIREVVRLFTISPRTRTADAAGRAGQATEADRMRAALFAAVSHDLRSPAAAAKAPVSCLRSRGIELTTADWWRADDDHVSARGIPAVPGPARRCPGRPTALRGPE